MQCRGAQRTWRAGFSLTEVMVGMGVLILLLGGIYIVVLAGQRSYDVGDTRIRVNQEARRALDAMAKELRTAGRASILFTDGDADALLDPGDSLAFSVVTGMVGGVQQLSTLIVYSLGGVNNLQLLRTQDGVSRVLANDVQQVSYQPTPAVGLPTTATLVILTRRSSLAGQSLSEQLQSQVFFRN
ncbi:MAG: hypothetical protein HY597_02685 [Candidatus Omnitrophica bacterium]|nr:hypothetical protein [Candidatus Omnitrophota bacterium]